MAIYGERWRVLRGVALSLSFILFSACFGSLTDVPQGAVNRCGGIRHGEEDNELRFQSVRKLIITAPGGAQSICTGSVIAPQTLLTAAHCVDEISTSANVQSETSGGQTILADQVLIHPAYEKTETYTLRTLGEIRAFVGTLDIALVHFPVPFGAQNLSFSAQSTNNLISETVTIVGYGRDENETSGTLRSGSASLVGQVALIGETDKQGLVVEPGSQNQISCPGDSGSPLLHEGEIIGVFSLYTRRNGEPSAKCEDTLNNTYISTETARDWVESELLRIDPPVFDVGGGESACSN